MQYANDQTYDQEKKFNKPKIFIVTSKIVNLLGLFVACVSVSTFFATRYITILDFVFNANILSTMVAAVFLNIIVEIYGRKTALKVFMIGAYSILLVFFLSAFIQDFNTPPANYLHGESIINFHQKILLCVFISYIVAFLLNVKLYLYAKEELNLNFLWMKSLLSLGVSQIVYTVIYNLLCFAFTDINVALYNIQSDLTVKFALFFLCMLMLYFIVSGIRSGFFNVARHFEDFLNRKKISQNYQDPFEQDLPEHKKPQHMSPMDQYISNVNRKYDQTYDNNQENWNHNNRPRRSPETRPRRRVIESSAHDVTDDRRNFDKKYIDRVPLNRIEKAQRQLPFTRKAPTNKVNLRNSAQFTNERDEFPNNQRIPSRGYQSSLSNASGRILDYGLADNKNINNYGRRR